MPQTIESVAAALQSLFTIVALSVGGAWTYILFFKRREAYPRARIRHFVRSVVVEGRVRIVRLAYKMENTGTVLLPLAKVEIKVQQLRPLPAPWISALQEGAEISRAESEIDWPVLFENAADCSAYELEPGESEDLQFDLELPHEVELLQVYSHMPNRAKAKSGIGWNCTSIHELNEGERHAEATQ